MIGALPLAGTWKKCTYNPGQNSLGQYYNINFFLSFLSSLLKQCILFEILLQFSLPHRKQSWNSEKIPDTRVQHCLWGEGRGWTCVNWKPPRKCKSVLHCRSTSAVSMHVSTAIVSCTFYSYSDSVVSCYFARNICCYLLAHYSILLWPNDDNVLHHPSNVFLLK